MLAAYMVMKEADTAKVSVGGWGEVLKGCSRRADPDSAGLGHLFCQVVSVAPPRTKRSWRSCAWRLSSSATGSGPLSHALRLTAVHRPTSGSSAGQPDRDSDSEGGEEAGPMGRAELPVGRGVPLPGRTRYPGPSVQCLGSPHPFISVAPSTSLP